MKCLLPSGSSVRHIPDGVYRDCMRNCLPKSFWALPPFTIIRSFGIPRRIGAVTEQALTYAMFSEKRTVDADMVLKVKSLDG